MTPLAADLNELGLGIFALIVGAFVLAILVLSRAGWNPLDLFASAADRSDDGRKYLEPGLFLPKPVDTVSLGLALVLGTAGLPHILMRFFTVPDAKARGRASCGRCS